MSLTERQLACLRLAAELHITRATVKTHMTRLRETLAARNNVHAVHIAHQRGLLTPDRRTTA